MAEPLTPSRDVAQLAARAWRQIDHALRTGILRTENGTELPLTSSAYAKLLQYVSNLDAQKKPRLIGLPEDVFLPETGA